MDSLWTWCDKGNVSENPEMDSSTFQNYLCEMPAINNVEFSTGVVVLDPCPNKLINCESINADLDMIYHQIYWECVLVLVSKERQNPRWDDCFKGKWRRSKVSFIQKEIFRQTQFPIWGCLFGQTTDGVQHRELLKPFSILLTSRSKHCLPLMVSRRLSARANPEENHLSTLNKRVQSELGVPLIPDTIHQVRSH